MSNLLITWYGITDIRSAMGFEIQGPILGALATGRFDSVTILAYTKKHDFSSDELQKQKDAIDFLENHQGDLWKMTREESFQFVDILANTPSGHQLFIGWLEKQLVKRDIKVTVTLQECFLRDLNDTEGIYFAAVKALENISEPNVDITFFLSPGTPVMAFSWALAMMASPKRSIKLLASPDFRKGVQTIDLPESVLAHIEKGRCLRHE